MLMILMTMALVMWVKTVMLHTKCMNHLWGGGGGKGKKICNKQYPNMLNRLPHMMLMTLMKIALMMRVKAVILNKKSMNHFWGEKGKKT